MFSLNSSYKKILSLLTCIGICAASQSISFADFPASAAGNEYFRSGFENGTDSWSSRGSCTVSSTDRTPAFSGEKTLYVSNRKEAWNGAGFTLDTSTFVPGSAYSFGVKVIQRQIETENFKLSLQYNLDGTAHYDDVATGTAGKDQWLELSNDSFVIPQGATDLLLYVETVENLTSFYIDEASGASDGTVYSAVPAFQKGDANQDGNIGAADVSAIYDYMGGKDTAFFKNAADMNADGTINLLDVLLIKELALDPPPMEEEKKEPDPPQRVEGQFYNTADISWIDPNKPMVALSFDDGPVGIKSTDTSIRIQDAIANAGFHATFFYSINLWGRNMNSELEKEILRANELGFEIANHTYSHPDLSKMSADAIMKEINDCSAVLTRITGKTDFLLRPPYLGIGSTLQQCAGTPLITCGIDSLDWNNASTQDMVNLITQKMHDGSLANNVVLMHETYASTAAAVEQVVPMLKQNGWQVVTVSEMFKVKNKVMYNGQVYKGAY